MGDGVGEQADAGFVADAGAHDGGELRRPDGGEGVVGEFDDIEVAGVSGPPKLSVKKSNSLVAVCASWLPEA